MLKIHNIAHNIKCDMFQHDILEVLLGIIAYVQRSKEENRQDHHQEGEHRVGTAKTKMGDMSRNVLEKKEVESRCTMYVSVRMKSVTMQARPMSHFKCRDHKL